MEHFNRAMSLTGGGNKSSASYLSGRSTPFNYNTSIINLKPFNPEIETTNVTSSLRTSKIEFDDHFLKPDTSSSGAHRRSFLVNKNFRFYQPLKDAEMFVEIDVLRSYLNSSINYGDKEGSNLTETSIKFQSDRLLSANSTIMPDAATAAVLSVTPTATTPTTLKSAATTNEETEPATRPSTEIENEENNNKVHLAVKSSQRTSSKSTARSIKSSPTRRFENKAIQRDAKNLLMRMMTQRAKTAAVSSMPSRSFRFEKISPQSGSQQNERHNNTAEASREGSLPQIRNCTNLMNQRNVSSTIRKSRQHRLDNIYSSNTTTITAAAPKPETADFVSSSAILPGKNLVNRVFYHYPKSSNNIDTGCSSQSSIECCEDPNCAFSKLMRANPGIINGSAMNSSRQRQRPLTQEECKRRLIASNVPSALITMGHFGKMTNIEKIIMADSYVTNTTINRFGDMSRMANNSNSNNNNNSNNNASLHKNRRLIKF